MPISIELDTHAIDLLALHNHRPGDYPFLLESVTHGINQGRFDILFAYPQSSISYHHLDEHQADQSFLKALDQQWRSVHHQVNRIGNHHQKLPFDGGWFLFLGYELSAEIEPILDLPSDPSGFPTAFAVRCPAAVICDHQTDRTWFVVAEDYSLRQLEWLSQIREHIAVIIEECDRIRHEKLVTDAMPLPVSNLVEEDSSRFLNSMQRVQDYIHAGDVFQVNLARRWQLDQRIDPIRIYAQLREQNPAPFAGLASWADRYLLSSSPERLLSVNQGIVSTRPIAGTHPRSQHGNDAAVVNALQCHPKERAEHVMLIDLERNDLGRICETGSITVDELMVIESYAHVHHIVSNISGQLRKGITPGQVISAVFPGGTITGCPKVRCMQIIAELEQRGRGAYTGSMGYLNTNGDMDLNILIRTIQADSDQVSFLAGCGVVADSQPEKELEETRSKAKGMLLALYPQSDRDIDQIAGVEIESIEQYAPL